MLAISLGKSIKKNYLPPGSDSNLLIYAPEKLVLIESLGKYVQLNKNTLQVMDKDETDIDSNALVNSKLPKSFQNRWAWSDSEKDGTRQNHSPYRIMIINLRILKENY